ncbi:MAG: hypothetical protein PVF70_07790 [Anaerolineales bacterium]|jgi:hypothetical protein
MNEAESERVSRLVRPTTETKFHIDYQWWERADRGLDVYLLSHLCPEHQATFASSDMDTIVDHVDPETAEVARVAAIQHILISHCSRQPGYLTPQTSLINAIFRTFLANGNQPLTPRDLGDMLNKPPRTILRTLSGPRVYKGIRPCMED